MLQLDRLIHMSPLLLTSSMAAVNLCRQGNTVSRHVLHAGTHTVCGCTLVASAATHLFSHSPLSSLLVLAVWEVPGVLATPDGAPASLAAFLPFFFCVVATTAACSVRACVLPQALQLRLVA